MRQVRTCDFCGDDATGLYEPLPPSIPDAPRLLLCDGCRNRLSSVVDPLLAAIEGDATTASPDAASGRHDATPGSLEEVPHDTGDARSEHAGTDAGARDAGAGPTGRRPPEASDEAAADSTDGGTAEPANVDVDANVDADGVGVDDPTKSSEASAVREGVSESRDASGRPQRERAGTPRGYRKVMRFLENRELPMARVEAEHLAAEAYDLEGDAVAECIDHAVQYGRLREVDDELKA